MTLQPNEELLSSYLDGEATSQEKILVEQRLASDAEYRKLFEELRAGRTAMRGLPRHRAPRELAGLVSQRINQSAPTGQRPAAPAAAKAVASSSVVQENQQLQPQVALAEDSARRFTPRTLFWPVMVIAAAILVMLFSPEKPLEERNLAQRDTRPLPSGNLVAGPTENAEKDTTVDSEVQSPRSPTESLANSQRREDPGIDRQTDVTSGEIESVIGDSAPTLKSQAMTAETPDTVLRRRIEQGEIIVIECELPEADDSAFAELLTKNKISLQPQQRLDKAPSSGSTEAILVEAPPEIIAQLIAGLSSRSPLAKITVHAGDSSKAGQMLAAATGVESAASDVPPALSNNKPTLKPQAITVEKSAQGKIKVESDKEQLQATARRVSLSAAEILESAERSKAQAIDSQTNANADDDAGSDHIHVIFVVRNPAN